MRLFLRHDAHVLPAGVCLSCGTSFLHTKHAGGYTGTALRHAGHRYAPSSLHARHAIGKMRSRTYVLMPESNRMHALFHVARVPPKRESRITDSWYSPP